MVYGLSNDPLQALKGLKQKGATTTTSTPNFTTIKGKTETTPTVGLKPKQLAEIGGYAGGFAGITKPTIGSAFGAPAGAEKTAMVNMPQEVQKRIVQQATTPTATPAIDTTEPQFMETNVQGQITEQSPVQLYADLKAGMPVGEASKYYPEYAANLATINQLKADIDAGMPEAMIPQYYPEFYPQATEETEQQRGGGVKGAAAAFSPIDLGPTGETLINPVGRVAEIIDNQVQKLGSFDFTKTAEENIDKRVANLSQQDLERYQKEREKYKKNNPGLAKQYTKSVEGKNLLAQMWNIVTGDTKDTDEVEAFKAFVRQREKKFVEELAGADTKGPHMANIIANAPGSALKTVSAIGRAVLNPADTLAGLGKIIFTAEGRQAIIDRYGSREAFAKTLETDPIGVASDVLAVVEGGAGIVKAGAKATAKVSARVGATETAKVAGRVAEKAGEFGKVSGIASDLGLRQVLPHQLGKVVKATENIPVVGKVMKYGQAMTTPLDTFIHVAKPLAGKLPSADETVQRMNRITAGDQRKFLKEQGVTEGERLNKNIGPTAPRETVEILSDRVKKNIEQVNKAVEEIQGPQKFSAVEYTNQYGDKLKYQGDAVLDMAKDGVERATDSNSPLLPVFEGLLDKYKKGQATMSDINKLQKLYQANTRMSYFKDMLAGNKTQRSTNIDSAVRAWKMKVGETYGFANFRDINKDTQASMSIIKGLTKRESGKMGNNAVSLTDWIMIAPAMIEPTHLAGLVTKKVLQSNRFAKNYARILNKLNGHKIAAQKAADLITISKINSEIELNKRLMSKESERLATTGLPSPKTVTPSKMGTPEQPIPLKGKIGEEVVMTGRRRNTVGQTDAPEIGDDTKLGKVVAVTHTGGGFPKYSVKIEGYRDFTPVEKIEGGIYEGTKESKATTKPAEVMPREEAPVEKKTEIVDRSEELGPITRYYAQGLLEELGFDSMDAIQDIAIRNEIARIVNMKSGDKVEEAVAKLKEKVEEQRLDAHLAEEEQKLKDEEGYVPDEEPTIEPKVEPKTKEIPLSTKPMKNASSDMSRSSSDVDTVPLQRKASDKDVQPRSEGNARPARGADVETKSMKTKTEAKAAEISPIDRLQTEPKLQPLRDLAKESKSLTEFIEDVPAIMNKPMDDLVGKIASEIMETNPEADFTYALAEIYNANKMKTVPMKTKAEAEATEISPKNIGIGTERNSKYGRQKIVARDDRGSGMYSVKTLETGDIRNYSVARIDEIIKNNEFEITEEGKAKQIADKEAREQSIKYEEEAKQKEAEAFRSFDEWTKGDAPMLKARKKSTLGMKMRYNGVIKTRLENVKSLVEEGRKFEVSEMTGDKAGQKIYKAVNPASKHREFQELTKTEYDYAKYLDNLEKGTSTGKIEKKEYNTSENKYIMTQRQPSPGAQPSGMIDSKEIEHNGRKAYELTYDRELTPDEISNYELQPLSTKTPKNDGPELQTKQGGATGSSDEIVKVSLFDTETTTKSGAKGEDIGSELKGGYIGDTASAGDGPGTGRPVSKTQQGVINKEVIQLLKDKEFSTNPKDYTPEEYEKLKQYEGGGGVTKEEGDFSGSNDEFYTPDKIIDDMRYLAKKYGYKDGATVLEPSAGIGRVISRKPMRTDKATGMEIDKTSGTIAKILNPNAEIKIGDYQDNFMDFTRTRALSNAEIEKLPKYDVVIGNPPYKERTTKQRNLGDLGKINRFEDYFMIRGLDQLKPDGTMVVIVPSSFMDKPQGYAKVMIQERGRLVDAYRLPNKAFPNTDVGTDILVFKKGPESEMSMKLEQAQMMEGGRYFKKHPEKVFGEEGTRMGRFGEEKYVKGTMEDIKIQKELTADEKYGPLTLKNLVTGKEEIVPTPGMKVFEAKTEAPTAKNELGMVRQKGLGVANKMTNTILDVIESNGGLKDGYLKVDSEGYMPLNIEGIGDNRIAVSHSYIQNGDVMRDPEIVFKVEKDGSLQAESIRQDPYGEKPIKANDSFVKERADNLVAQGFVKKTTPEVIGIKPKQTVGMEAIGKESMDELTAKTEKLVDSMGITEAYELMKNNLKKASTDARKANIQKSMEIIKGIAKAEMDEYNPRRTSNLKGTMQPGKLITPERYALQEEIYGGFNKEKQPTEIKVDGKPVKLETTKTPEVKQAPQGLFDIPTKVQEAEIAEKIVSPEKVKTVKISKDGGLKVTKEDLSGTTTRVFNHENIHPSILRETLDYQEKTNVFGEVEGVDYTKNPQLLNYMDGKTFLNYEYFSGDIFQKLDQLESDKRRISDDQYKKQREGLLARLPEQQTLENIRFSAIENPGLLGMDTGELHTVSEYKYDPQTKRGEMIEKDVPLDIATKFKSWLREEGMPSRPRVSAQEIINYMNGKKIDKDKSAIIKEDTEHYFNKFIKEGLTEDLKKKIIDNHNRKNRSVVPIDTTQIPIIIKNMSETFRGKVLKLKDVQIQGILKATNKGAYIIAHGVGYGKTMEGIVATVVNMQKGISKRPVFIVPGQTMEGRKETIKALFPTYKVNELGTLDVKMRSKLEKERGTDKSKWIADNTITIMTHSAFENQIAFKTETQNKIGGEFLDDMATEDMSAKQMEALYEKNEATVGAVATTKVKTGGDFSMYDKDFITEQYAKIENMGQDEFVKQFVEADTTKNPLSKMKAQEMYALKPIYMEDLGFDAITVDEMHNFKNVFSKAKIEEGNKNMFGDVQGSTSKRGMKMAIATNYILANNNGKGVLGLTATPFNNQAIEVYNILNFVARARLKRLGITNMNEFMSMFSDFKEELVVRPSGTDVSYRSIQKNFKNLQDLQRLVNEFIDYKGDSPEIIKPVLKNITVKLQMSDLQKQVQMEIESRIDANKEKGDVIGGQQEARANVVSPYFTNRAGAMPTAEEFMKNSPKIDFFAQMVKEKKALGNTDGAIIFAPQGVPFHELMREGISLRTGVPIEKIGIINGTAKYKKDMVKTANKFNSGEYEILIGGDNINEGIDLQHKTVMMYDTLLGRNPTVTTQKTGRAWRQGNMRNVVMMVTPLMENSVDSVMMQKMEEKQSRINDIFSAEGEVFSVEDIDPAEEKLALMTDPIKKAKIAINIEAKKLTRHAEALKGDIAELERHKANLEAEMNTIPNMLRTIDEYKGRNTNGQRDDFIKRYEKDVASIQGKADRSREKIKKNNINVEADMKLAREELEKVEKEIKELGDTLEKRASEYVKQQEAEIANRKDRQYYLDQIKEVIKEVKIFETQEQQKAYVESVVKGVPRKK